MNGGDGLRPTWRVGVSVPTERPPRFGRYVRTVGFRTGTASGRFLSSRCCGEKGCGREAKAPDLEQNGSARGVVRVNHGVAVQAQRSCLNSLAVG
jgi:hypothetical protein